MANVRVSKKQVLLRCRGKKILLLGHENADLDALCSETIFHGFLKQNKVDSVIGVPRHLNERAQNFCLSERISFALNPDLGSFDLVVLFDVNTPEQLGRLRDSFESMRAQGCFEVMVFDHHVLQKGSIVKGRNAFVSEDCVSTTQLLYNFFGKSFTREMHFWNCLGIMEDTGHFLTGDVAAFKSFSDSLEKCKRPFGDVLALAKHFVPADERTAFLKAAQRAQILHLNSALVVTSTVSFYQSAAASKLLGFGADVALVAGQERDGLTTLSGRVDSEFKEKHKFNLMTHMLLPLQSVLGGDCGGHSGAAQWRGKASSEKVLETAIGLLKKSL